MDSKKILLVEDNKQVQMIVHAALTGKNAVDMASTIKEAEAFIEKASYSLILLDVMLPDGDGYEFCQKLRTSDKFVNLPIIFLTSKAEVADRVHGFAIGADDYIVKPIEPSEFIARIEARLRRANSDGVQTSFTKSHFRADLIQQKVFQVEGSEEKNLGLTPIEFKLLVHFLKNTDHVFSREELLRIVWGTSVHLSDHTVDTHISSLRKKIGESGTYLKAVVKKGYCFSLPPSTK